MRVKVTPGASCQLTRTTRAPAGVDSATMPESTRHSVARHPRARLTAFTDCLSANPSPYLDAAGRPT